MPASDLKLRVVLDLVERVTQPFKAMLRGNTALMQSFKSTQAQLKALGQNQKEITAFRQLQTSLRDTATALGAARQRVDTLKASIAASDAPTAALIRKFAQASTAVHQLGAEYQQQSTRLGGMHSQLERAGIQTGRLTQHEERLRHAITATSQALSVQQGQLSTLAAKEQRVAALRTQLHTAQSKATSLAVAGYAAQQVGKRGLHLLSGPLHETKQIERENTRIEALGFNKEITTEAQSFAHNIKTTGTSITENLELMRDAMSIFGDLHHAKLVLPTIAKMKFANEALYGGEEGSEKDAYLMSMMKVIELRGGLANAQRFKQEADRVQKVLSTTSAQVGPEEWRAVIQTGGVAAKLMRPDAFYYQLEPLIQEMGGHSVGKALMSAYNNLYQGKTTVKAAKELARLGLLDPQKVRRNKKTREVTGLGVGALKGGELFKDSPLEWLEQYLLPTLQKHGITRESDITDKIATIVTDRTAANLITSMVMQRESIHIKEKNNSQADDIDTLTRKAQKIAYGKELEALVKSRNLHAELGEQIMPLYHRGLEKTIQLTKLATQWIKAHTSAVKGILIAVSVLATTVAGLGAAAIGVAAVLGPIAIMRFAFMAAGLQGAKLLSVVTGIGQGLLWLGRLALANPLGILISVLAGGAFLIWKNWATLGPKFAAIWDDIKAGFSAMREHFVEAGTQWIEGLMQGISTALGPMYRLFTTLQSYLPRLLLGPSGLPQIQENARPSPIRFDTSEAPVRAVRSATALSMGGDTIHIHLQAAPGMDAATLARMIQSELEQRDLTKQARYRSAFTENWGGVS